MKAEPGRIEEIHELDDYPELKEFVRVLNRQDCVFRTIRTDTAKDFFKRPDSSNSCFSLVTVGFDYPEAAGDARLHENLYHTFVDYALFYRLPDEVVLNFVLI